jgi:hypothetical protein
MDKRQIQDTKPFVLAFATAVTAHSSDPSDWVARRGKESLFEALQIILPEVDCMNLWQHQSNQVVEVVTAGCIGQIIQPGNGRHRLKGKISSPEFNKYIQVHGGFVCARTRKKVLERWHTCYLSYFFRTNAVMN